MRNIHGFVKGAVIAVAAGATAMLGHVPTADAGGRSRVSISFGFPVGDHGYVSVGSYRGWGHGRSYRHYGYSSHRYGYGHGYRYDDCHYRPVYVRPISRVCYDPWPGYYSHRSRAVVYGTSNTYRYSSADDLRGDSRVYNVANDNASYMSSQSLVAESSLPDESHVDRSINNEATATRPGYAQQRRTTTAASRPYIRQAAATVSMDDAFAMLDRGEDAEAQRAFAGLLARNPRNSHATVGYGLASAALDQVERAERAFAQASAANPDVWDTLGKYPATRSMAVTLLGDSAFADSPVMRAPLDRLSVAADPSDPAMPTFDKVAGRE